MKKYILSVHLWFWMALIILSTVGVMFFFSFFVPQQVVQEPVDLIFCDTDEDCTTTTTPEKGCSPTCPRVVSVKGSNYLAFLQEANCKVKDDSLPENCAPPPTSFCEDNECTPIRFEGRRIVFLNSEQSEGVNLGNPGTVELGVKNYKDTPLRFTVNIEIVNEPNAAQGNLDYNVWFPDAGKIVRALQPSEWTRLPIQLIPPTGIFQGEYTFNVQVIDQDSEQSLYAQGALTITVGR